MTVRYFAYGSNLWPPRLIERVPGARVVGRAHRTESAIRFHKRSDVDGSGKASLVFGDEAGVAWGALYDLPERELAGLDRAEGLGVGYERRVVTVTHDDGTNCNALTYVARPEVVDESLRPFAWYKAFVVAGAEFHGLPDSYVEQLRAVEAIVDPDPHRRLAARVIMEDI